MKNSMIDLFDEKFNDWCLLKKSMIDLFDENTMIDLFDETYLFYVT